MGGERFTGRGRRVGWEERSSQVGETGGVGGEKFTGRGRRVGWEERSSQVEGDGWGGRREVHR